jgi:hypothetical protein
MASPITSVTREKIVVQPPTLVCCILPVLSSTTAPGGGWTVTVAARPGVTVTVDLAAAAVPTYECCHAALRRATGHPFRYLPVEPQTASAQAPIAPKPGVAVATRQKSAEDQARCVPPTGSGPPTPEDRLLFILGTEDLCPPSRA